MGESLSDRVLSEVEVAKNLYHRLVILAGPPMSEKSSALRQLAERFDWPLVNLNLLLSERLLELAMRQRALRVGELVEDILQEANSDIVLLDNMELLFHPDLKTDPLRLLQNLSRNRTIVAAWQGQFADQALTYAAPGHQEFRRYSNPQVLIVSSHGHLRPHNQEHSA